MYTYLRYSLGSRPASPLRGWDHLHRGFAFAACGSKLNLFIPLNSAASSARSVTSFPPNICPNVTYPYKI